MLSNNGTMIYQKYMEYKSVLVLYNVKPHERDLPIYSNVRERDHQRLLIYLEVRERILSILLIYFNVHGKATHSECIADKERQLLSFIDVGTRLLSDLSLRLDNVLLVSNNGIGIFQVNFMGLF